VFASDVYVSHDIFDPHGVGIRAATEMEFVTKLKTFAMDLKTRLLPYVSLMLLLYCFSLDYLLLYGRNINASVTITL